MYAATATKRSRAVHQTRMVFLSDDIEKSSPCSDLVAEGGGSSPVDNKGPRQGNDPGQLSHMVTMSRSGMVSGKTARLLDACRVDTVARGEVTRMLSGSWSEPTARGTDIRHGEITLAAPNGGLFCLV